ncbi:Non-specific lipid-transfer protein 1-like protein [Drosera capensis]
MASSLAKSLRFTVPLLVGIIVVASTTPFSAEALIPCAEVYGDVIQCAAFVLFGGVPSKECCDACKKLKNESIGKLEEVKQVCRCLQAGKAFVLGALLNYTRMNEIPNACGFSIPYKIAPNTDCDKPKR